MVRHTATRQCAILDQKLKGFASGNKVSGKTGSKDCHITSGIELIYFPR